VKAALGGTGISSNSQAIRLWGSAIRQRGNLGVNSNFTYNAAICTAWPCYESSRVSQNDVSAVCAVDHSLDGHCSHSGVRGRKFLIRIRSRFPFNSDRYKHLLHSPSALAIVPHFGFASIRSHALPNFRFTFCPCCFPAIVG